MSQFPPPDYHPEFSHSGAPASPGNLAGFSGLGNLAQSARRKEIRGARTILLVIGILNLLLAALFFFGGPSVANAQIDKEIREAALRGEQFDPADIQKARDESAAQMIVASLVLFGLGMVYMVLATLVGKFPVPVTMIGLIVYVGSIAAGAAVDPSSLLAGGIIGIAIRIAIILGLVRALRAAIAYQKDLKRVAGKPGAAGLGADL